MNLRAEKHFRIFCQYPKNVRKMNVLKHRHSKELKEKISSRRPNFRLDLVFRIFCLYIIKGILFYLSADMETFKI